MYRLIEAGRSWETVPPSATSLLMAVADTGISKSTIRAVGKSPTRESDSKDSLLRMKTTIRQSEAISSIALQRGISW